MKLFENLTNQWEVVEKQTQKVFELWAFIDQMMLNFQFAVPLAHLQRLCT